MVLRVNGRNQQVEAGTTIADFLNTKGINSETVVIEYNYEMPDREKWGDIVLKENDNLEILKIIGGG